MTISAALVKELRERTGAGMMDCKKALIQTNGDIEQGIELLRTLGVASAEKKSGRIAAEGAIVQLVSEDRSLGVLVEINCETDFVAKDNSFKEYATAVGQCLLAGDQNTMKELEESELHPDISVNQARQELISKIGENLTIRRSNFISITNGFIGAYVHNVEKDLMGKIGVLISVETNIEFPVINDFLKKICMHIAASNPISLSSSDIDKDILKKEKDFQLEEIKKSGKDKSIQEKILVGKMNKYFNEVV